MRLVYEPLTDIPQNFTEVEYLQSSGTQYIDTGVKSSGSLKAELVLESKATSGSGNIFGLYSQNNDCFAIFQQSSSLTYCAQYRYVDNNSGRIVSNVSSPNNKITAVLDKGAFYINGNLIGSKTYDNFSSTRTLFLFAINREDGGGILGPNPAKVYLCKIYNNDILVRDFVPCLDNNNIPCMYDKVEGKAYYNAGTGSFTYGRKIIPVEYLESTGTQYINTGVNANSNPKYELKFVISYTNPSSPSPQYTGADYGGTFGVVNGNWQWSNNVPVTANQFYEIDYINQNGSRGAYVNGTDYYQGSNYSSFGYMCLLFTSGQDSSGATKTNLFSAKMKSCSIALSDTIVRDFIPCKDENNVGFMFDRVTHTAYLNAGTGSFITGSVKPKKKLRLIRESKRRLPKGFKEVEYIQSSGTQYIDLGITSKSSMRAKSKFNLAKVSAQAIFGSANAISNGVGVFFGTASTGAVYCNNTSNTISPPLTLVANTDYEFDMSLTAVSINGVNYTASTTSDNNYNMLLFARILAGSVDRNISGKIYYFKLYDNGVLVRDFIPCLDASNVPCMYDLVEGKAYYNAGTGSFTYGHKIIPVEYLQTDSTAYIDTGIKGDLTTELESVASVITGGQNGVTNIAGNNRDNTKAITINVACPNPEQAESRIRFSNTSTVIPAGTIPLNSYYKYTTNKNTFTALDSSGSVVFTYNFNATTAFETTGNLCIGRLDDASPQYIGTVRHKELKIKKSGALVRDYIPVKDENNVGYMFDKVTHSLYANAGTGAFVVGNEIKQDITRFVKDDIPNIYRKVSYLQSSGTQYIDTGIIPTNTHGISINFSFSSDEAFNTSWVPMGARSGDNRFWINKSVETSGMSFGWGGVVSSFLTQPKNTILHTSLNLYNDRKRIYSNQNYSSNIDTNLTALSNQIYLFGGNLNGSLAVQPPDCRIYSAQITKGSALVRDFVPVVRKYDNKPGMYDRVTKQFFINAGTGEFIIPT